MADDFPKGDYGDSEAARRRDDVVKRMLATPPKPRERPASKAKKVKPE